MEETPCLTFTIPGRGVSGNFRTTAIGGRFIKTKEAREENNRVRMYIAVAMHRVKWIAPKWFATRIVLWNSLQDLDNQLKIILDAMRKAAVQDDRYHLETFTTKRWDDAGPRIEVSVWSVDPVAYGREPDRPPHGTADATKRRVDGVPRGRKASVGPFHPLDMDSARPLPPLSRRA